MTERAVVGGGCFWCIEAAYKQLDGVEDVTSGYAGGTTADPSYQEVCTGKTGHAEVVEIRYNKEQLSYRDILDLLFRIHDPTTEDRQGPDRGSQYRSIILPVNEEQQQEAHTYIEERQDDFEDRIVTEVTMLDQFHPAAEEHQNYFEKHPYDAYCTMHARPKVETAQQFDRDREAER
ncbi:MAG: peptide-methionine (S)-S-oxide reductase MsrA [Candidatus Nanohaloarchaea archaeon]|nr:peptide-methionine (S)-S-oxide reductase MsrA [Candidatus Nanohaloarchaea archaeon]